jgi:quercetin dioxygenase-like cupin family protein
MKVIDAITAARAAVSANPSRPAAATVQDAPGVRLVVLRIEPEQEVAPHVSEATVLLTVLDGTGIISGGEGEKIIAGPGSVVVFEPQELHGMRATGERFTLLATIVRKH